MATSDDSVPGPANHVGPPRSVKQPVSPMLTGPYGHPFHPITVTVPIGAWVASLVFDILSFFVAESVFAFASLWLIALGVVGGLVAAAFGLLDFFTIPPRTPAFRTARTHLILNLTVIVAYAINFGWRQTRSEDFSVGIGMFALSAVSLVALLISGYLGGKLAFRYGIRVADEATQAEGFRPSRRSHSPEAP